MKTSVGSKRLVKINGSNIHWSCIYCLGTGSARVNNWNSPRARTCCGEEFYKGRDRLLVVWTDMVSRCTNPKHPAYSRYFMFGKPDWNNFSEFKTWALGSGWSYGLDIDRINNSLGYSANNCRFVSRSINCRNKSNNRMLSAFGETKTLADWIDDARCVVSHGTLTARVDRYGWGAERAISQEIQ